MEQCFFKKKNIFAEKMKNEHKRNKMNQNEHDHFFEKVKMAKKM